jgi:DnaK suppressor protein
MKHLTPEFVEEMKNTLLAKQKTLLADISGIKVHTEEGEDLDSNAQEIAEDEVNQDVIFTIKKDLEKIEKALAKIEDGTYGLDDEGKEIGMDRLRALPWADKAI